MSSSLTSTTKASLTNTSASTISSRKLWAFHGGVHPPFHKDDSNQTPIKSAGIPKQLIFPLR